MGKASIVWALVESPHSGRSFSSLILTGGGVGLLIKLPLLNSVRISDDPPTSTLHRTILVLVTSNDSTWTSSDTLADRLPVTQYSFPSYDDGLDTRTGIPEYLRANMSKGLSSGALQRLMGEMGALQKEKWVHFEVSQHQPKHGQLGLTCD